MPTGYRSKRSRSGTRRLAAGPVVSRPRRSRKTWPGKKNWTMYYDPFPTMQRAQLRYITDIQFDPPTGTPVHHFFNATSIFDPDTTGTGHQPYGRDQYASIYNHYRVDKSIINITNTNNASSAIIGICPQDNTTQNLDRDTCRERKGCTIMPLLGNRGPSKAQLTYSRKGTFPLDTNDSLSSGFNQNPAENVFFDVFAMGSAANSNPASLTLQVTITYWVTMWEPRVLSGS